MKLVTKLKIKAQFPYFVKPTLIYVNIRMHALYKETIFYTRGTLTSIRISKLAKIPPTLLPDWSSFLK